MPDESWVPPAALRDVADLDFDGRREWLLHDAGLQIAVRDDGLAALCELSSYPLKHNFGDTLRRYAEHYHAHIDQTPGETPQGDGIASAHDIVRCKHPIAPEDIVPDALPRAIAIDRIDGEVLGDYRAITAGSSATALAFARDGIDKTYTLADGALYLAKANGRNRVEAATP